MSSLFCRKHTSLYRNWNIFKLLITCRISYHHCSSGNGPVKLLQTTKSTSVTSPSQAQVPLAQSTLRAYLNRHVVSTTSLLRDPSRTSGSEVNHEIIHTVAGKCETKPHLDSNQNLVFSTTEKELELLHPLLKTANRTVVISSNQRSFSTSLQEDESTKPLLKPVKRSISSTTTHKSSPTLEKNDETESLPDPIKPVRKRKLSKKEKNLLATTNQDESTSSLLDPETTQKPVQSTISSTAKEKNIINKENVPRPSESFEQHSSVKLKEGDAALVIKESEDDKSAGSRVNRYSLDDVQQKFNALPKIVKKNSAIGHLNNFGQMYKSLTGKEMDLKYCFSRAVLDAAPGGGGKAGEAGETPAAARHWSCVARLRHPLRLEVRSVAATKSAAKDLAAKLVMAELQAGKHMNVEGKPRLSDEARRAAQAPLSETPPVASLEDLASFCEVGALEGVAQMYDKHIVPLMQMFEQEEKQRRENQRLAEEARELEKPPAPDPTEDIAFFTRPFNTRGELQRNQQLEHKAQVLNERSERSLQSGQRKKLPIEDYRAEIVDTVAASPITIVKGEPGCGKSTQVAQMILNEASLQGKGSSCNILITQPRRISAISLAKRVASEREEPVGESVGYQVRLQHIFPRHAGHIQFITTGILLSRLQTQRGLDQVSHIILDEAHERDISTDLLLLLTKRLLETRPGLKVLVMSATLNAEMFQRYFLGAPVLHIPGFTHPVQRNYLSLENCRRWNLCKSEEDTKNLVTSKEPTTNSQVICNLIQWIHRNKPEGAILCFLPGWQDIVQVSRLLTAGGRHVSTLQVTMAHSKLDTEVQGAIFQHPPPGVRKVVLSTNVAETSITIDDVSYVVDTGCHKETRYDAKDDVVSLDNHWISRASVNQRAGRAGRTKPGESFHLYTEERYRKMAEYSLPEIFRKPLEEILLTCKLYGNEKSADFLSQLPEPPDAASIEAAVSELKVMGVFDAAESLTPLGKRIAAIQCHPKLACALVYGVVFKCALPLGNIVTLLSTPERPLFENALLNTSKDAIREIKASLSRYSDHIAGSRLLNDWGANSTHRRGHLLEFLHERNLRHLYDVRDQLMNTLYNNRLLDEETDWAALTPGRGLIQSTQHVNKMAHIDEWVRAILYAGVQNLLLAKTGGKNRLRTEQGQMCVFVRESVNSGLKSSASPLLVYYDATTSLQRRITSVRDSSVISPLAVLLFRRGTATLLSRKDALSLKPDLSENECVVSLKNELKPCNIIVPDESQALLLLRMRDMISRLSLFFISHQGHPLAPPNIETYEALDRYWDSLLDSLAPLFAHYSGRIDEHRPPPPSQQQER